MRATMPAARGKRYCQVALVQDADHEMMIRLFFAMKVWVLKEKFSLPE
jgi:hypothetical protein